VPDTINDLYTVKLSEREILRQFFCLLASELWVVGGILVTFGGIICGFAELRVGLAE
jgi:hypothetical protein